MFNKVSPRVLAFLQASCLVIYVMLLSLFFSRVVPHLNDATGETFGPIIMPLLFVISAVISGTLVLGRAGMLFWEKKYKDSFELVALTVGWSLVYLVILVFLATSKTITL